MSVFRVIDIETSGTDPLEHEVLELAFVDIIVPNDESGPLEYNQSLEYETLIRPTKPIPPETSAIHHLTEADFDNNWFMPESVAEAWSQVQSDLHVPDYYVAHNARFESAFLRPEHGFDRPWLCTYKLAAQLFPDAPSHGNQVLRYWLLKADCPRDVGPAHRALADVRVTARIFLRILKHYISEPAELLAISQRPVLQRTCRFGKHAGKPWAEIDKGYLRWILAQDFDEDVKFTAQHWLDQ